MQAPAIPENEQARLEYLWKLRILDTEKDEAMDDITARAKAHFNVPICLVSLVDANRQWFKSSQGLDATETPRDISFCGHAINYDDILHIPDALEDFRFKTNPLVTGDPNIRFYAGAPLIMEPAIRLGTLCIIDREPRDMSEQQLDALRSFADEVQLELARFAQKVITTNK